MAEAEAANAAEFNDPPPLSDPWGALADLGAHALEMERVLREAVADTKHSSAPMVNAWVRAAERAARIAESLAKLDPDAKRPRIDERHLQEVGEAWREVLRELFKHLQANLPADAAPILEATQRTYAPALTGRILRGDTDQQA